MLPSYPPTCPYTRPLARGCVCRLLRLGGPDPRAARDVRRAVLLVSAPTYSIAHLAAGLPSHHSMRSPTILLDYQPARQPPIAHQPTPFTSCPPTMPPLSLQGVAPGRAGPPCRA